MADDKDRGHALLNASAAKRWINCTPSARLSEQLLADGKVKDTESEAAREGTYAHEAASLYLQEWNGAITRVERDEKLRALKAGKTEYGNYYNAELAAYVKDYVHLVQGRMERAKKADANSMLLIEERIDYGRYAPNGYGYTDAIIVSDSMLNVIDLKYGQGVDVEATDNSQLRLYALGAWDMLNWCYDMQSVTCTIYQPRRGGLKEETLSIADLLAWGNSIKPKADMAWLGKGEAKAGDWCRWCVAADRCSTCASLMHDYLCDTPPAQLTDDEVAKLLPQAEQAIMWANKLITYATAAAIDGKKWPGLKLVEGRSRRVISDQVAAIKALHKMGLTDTQIYKPASLKGLTDLEKLAGGKKKLTNALGDAIGYQAGKPCLVADDPKDKRPEYNSAATDFEVIA